VLMRSLSEQAPNVTLNVLAFSDRDEAIDLLDAGKIDAAIGVPPTRQEGRIMTRELLRDEFVTIVHKDNAAARRNLTMKSFLSLRHVLVSPEGNRYGLVDQELAKLGLKRELRLTLPEMFVVPAVLAATDLAATVLKRVAIHSPASSRLVIFPPPVPLPEVTFVLTWHRRNEGSAAQQWLRDTVVRVAAQL
jgi:DNA-binding transcriptional LysR family regulator